MRIAELLRLPCGATLPNRLAKGAMTEGLATANGVPTPALDRLYRCWSEGGAGMHLTGNVIIDRDHLERPGNVIIDRPPSAEMKAALASWAKAGTVAGNHLWMQISHAGRQTQAIVNKTPKAPSAVPLGLPGGQFGMPIPLTDGEIKDLIQRFAIAAAAAKEAGFTGVQIHAAHGYLLHEFLSPISNKRTDEYGGSFENRIRLLCEIASYVRLIVPASHGLFVRISASDWIVGGWSIEDSVALSRELKARGVDLIDCSSAGISPEQQIEVGPGYQVKFARQIQQEAGILTNAVGMITTGEQAEEILSDGAVSAVMIARAMLGNPRWPIQAAADLGDEIPWPNQYARGFTAR